MYSSENLLIHKKKTLQKLVNSNKTIILLAQRCAVWAGLGICWGALTESKRTRFQVDLINWLLLAVIWEHSWD